MTYTNNRRGLLIGILLLSSLGMTYASATDPTQLPLGDKKVTTSPKVGYVYVCSSSTGRGGAQITGSWIHGSTWNLNEKTHVQGSVRWPNAKFTITSSTSTGRVITGNGLPVTTPTGIYPIGSTDPAYQVDRNPNSITTQSISYTLPLHPTVAQNPSCVSMGTIGIALNGTPIFNAFDAENRDAVANEVQDSCGGHPQQEGMYHYHGPTTCLPGYSENNALIGYALDGFGIYSNHDGEGREIATKDLDECHGMTSEVVWDGKKVSMYHYVLTQDFPYNIGCFKGTPITTSTTSTRSTPRNSGVPSDNSLIITTTSNLTIGSSGDDVLKLQTTLEQEGFLRIPQGIAKGYFGKVTQAALMKYQKANNITPTGVFGSKTRAFHNGKNSGENSEGTHTDGKQSADQHTKPGSQIGTMPIRQSGNGDTSSQNTPVDHGVASPGSGAPGEMHTPPVEAVSACDEVEEGGSCSFIAPGNRSISGTCKEVKESLACVPAH